VTAGPARAGRPAADAREEPSLTATSWPWERNTVAHKQSPRVVPPLAVRSEWSALVESSLDVSSEVAALRPSAARRSWLVGLGGIGAIVALLAVGAPRERTLALHWLRQEYQARMQPLVESTTGGGITETGALRPTAMAANDVATSSAPPSGSAAGTALPGADMPPAASPSAASLAARTVADVPRARDGAEQNVTAAEPARDAHANEKPASEKPPAQDAFAKGTETKAPTAKATSARTTNARATTAMAHEAHSATGGPVKARARVAAPRKPSTDPAALAANVTKPRATRQNSPRKDTGGGIIRETPF